MRTLTKMKKLFRIWRPKQNVVYCSKVVITPHKYTTDKYIAVVIQINHKNYLGTCRVKDRFCEIRCKKLNAIIPLSKLKFDKIKLYFPKKLARESKELIKKENHEAVLLKMVKYFPNKEFWRRFTLNFH